MEEEAFGYGASYMTEHNLWGSQPGWASSFGEAYINFANTSSSDGPKGYNYVNATFTGTMGLKVSHGNEFLESNSGEILNYAGYGNIFDFNAIIEGYALQQKSVSNQGNQQEGMSGWEKAGFITETTAFTFELTEHVVEGAQSLANKFSGTASKILNAPKGLAAGLGILNIAITTGDGLSNGWENHHTADIAISAAEIALGLFEVSSPAGWLLAGSMFLLNTVTEHYYSKSVTQMIFDND